MNQRRFFTILFPRTSHKSLLVSIGMLALVGCSTFSNQTIEEQTRGWSEAKLYKAATDEIAGFDFEEASEYLERLDAQYPNSRYAQQALLDLAYAYYKNQETDLSIVTAERFVTSYPNHPNADYALYIRGIANYDRGFGTISKIFPPDPALTDQTNSIQSFRYFSELVERYPQSRYADDARQRMQFIRNNLGKYEATVGNYYLERQAYVAAVNRAKAVLQNFQTTPASKGALAIMVDAYTQLGQPVLARDAYDTLQATYPDSLFTRRSRNILAGNGVKSMASDIDNL